MKKCPFCAEEIKDEAIVCRYCGRDLPIANSPQQKIEVIQALKDEAPPPQKRDLKKIALIGGAVIVLLLIIWFGFVSAQTRISWSGDEVYCFGSEFDFNEYNKALDERNTLIFSYITDDPSTISLDNGTRVKVIIKGSGLGAAKIQVLEGYHKDRACWTYQMALE